MGRKNQERDRTYERSGTENVWKYPVPPNQRKVELDTPTLTPDPLQLERLFRSRHGLDFRIARHQWRILQKGCGGSKTVGVRNGVSGLQGCGQHDQLVMGGDGRHPRLQRFQDPSPIGYVTCSHGKIEDLAEIHYVHRETAFAAVGCLQ